MVAAKRPAPEAGSQEALEVLLFDYGVGNIHSIRRGLQQAGAVVELTDDPTALQAASAIVLPGVGAFGAAMKALGPTPAVRRSLLQLLLHRPAVPLLGVCVGLQILCRRSEESRRRGLGYFPTDVVGVQGPLVPHMGWDPIVPVPPARGIAALRRSHPALRLLPAEPYLYFAHSFGPAPWPGALALCPYGEPFVAVAARGGVVGVQFHPEKSGPVGAALLRGWVRWAYGLAKERAEAGP